MREIKIICRFTNNSRRMHGLPLRRKKSRGKRYRTRCRTWEDFCAWYDAITEGGE